jgi:tRNA threonylcarbamoyladenosine biosynthesis protein TsaE
MLFLTMQHRVSLNELDSFAKEFWRAAGPARVFAFHGEMGAGKTTIITALCRQKNVQQVPGSPTFSIINEYAYHQDGTEKVIYHIDLYRLKDEQEIAGAGVEDCVYSGSICMVEWPERAPQLFDDTAVHVYISTIDADTRLVKLSFPADSLAEQS